MSTFATAPALASVTPLDPSKHVNFTRGMVLGEEDFEKEFDYLSGRDRWLARDLIGYGAVSGLALSVDDPPAGEEDRGARIGVSSGVAVLPSGQLVCVSPAQCAFLGEWVRSKRDELESGSPPSELRAAVVACYAECKTDDVPIPGEPCRSEDNLMAPSRVKDHFTLELRLTPPAQREEEAVRRLAAWLAQVPVADTGSELGELLEALRAAGSEPAGSPPSTASFLDEPPPDGLVMPRARVSEYLGAAFALWTMELRARWRTRVPGCECEPGPGCPPDEDCLLLGEVVVPLTWDSVSGEVLVGGADEVTFDLSNRPTLLHLRLLQEWLLAAGQRGGGERATRAIVRVDVSPPEVAGEGLDVDVVSDRIFHLVPERFDPAAAYVVTGTGIAAVSPGSPPASPPTFELLDPLDPDLPPLLAGAGVTDPGVTVRVQEGTEPPSRGFAVRVERIGGAA